jgi:hypothetical protein
VATGANETSKGVRAQLAVLEGEATTLASDVVHLGHEKDRTIYCKKVAEATGIDAAVVLQALVDLHAKIEEHLAGKNGHASKAIAAEASYRVESGFVHEVGGTQNRLSDFAAWVVEYRRIDDGTAWPDKPNELVIEGIYYGGPEPQALPTLYVNAGEYDGLTWIGKGWPWVMVYPGPMKREHLRAAIKSYKRADAKHTTILTHTGWTKLENGERAYLHAAGAITAERMRDDVRVEPGGRGADERVRRFRLRLPANDDELRAACRASFAMLDLGERRVTMPVFAMTYLAALGQFVPLRLTGYQYGPTGSFKTSLAALGQAHYGDYSLDCLPLNFDHGTKVGVELVLFTLKDALIVADDFLKTGPSREVDKRRQMVGHIIRSVGNQTSGARGTKNLTP